MKSGGIGGMAIGKDALRVVGGAIKGVTDARKKQVQQLMKRIRDYVKANKAAILAECDTKYSDATKRAAQKVAINKFVNEGSAKMRYAELPEFVRTTISTKFSVTVAEYAAAFLAQVATSAMNGLGVALTPRARTAGKPPASAPIARPAAPRARPAARRVSVVPASATTAAAKGKDVRLVSLYELRYGKLSKKMKQRYWSHVAALRIIARYLKISKKEFKQLKRAFNSFWWEQADMKVELDATSLEAKLTARLKKALPVVRKAARQAVPKVVDRAIATAKGDDSGTYGLKDYLKSARGDDSGTYGLKDYLKSARGDDSGTYGLKDYLKSARGDDSGTYGLKDYLKSARGDDSTYGLKDVLARKGKASAQEVTKVKKAHKKFVTTINDFHASMVAKANLEFATFKQAATGSHKQFVKAMIKRHAVFEVVVRKRFAAFKAWAPTQKAPTLARIAKRASAPDDPKRSRFANIMLRIGSIVAAVAELDAALDRKRGKMSSDMGASHKELSAFFSSKHKQLKKVMKTGYQQAKSGMQNAYDVFKKGAKTEYDRLKGVFDAFLRKHASTG